jgi:hypothetical protein
MGHKPLNDIHAAKVAEFKVRILIIQVVHHQLRWMKMYTKQVKVIHNDRGYTINGVRNSTS